ncbi:DUF6177 family protein [Streptomyces sp. S07_1.15]|uniref:DUF6177 family protein n=1 Tax=Streptomyces sp. S07_1.15 TaxID=2873925 RepID=UPI001D14FB61|nr:DUF6177 family protein [Streptomyces sp. S07_1.15]MCC3653170.1 DUF6177 family protein [Streptomyces sp. S07_1.15]
MTQDVIALTPRMPDVKTLLAGLYAGGPDLRVDRAAGGSVVQLCADDGQVLVSLEAPRYVQVPGETGRLLGVEASADGPVWWTEVRALSTSGEAGRLAGSVAGRLTAVLGGTTWPRDAAHTGVVAVPAQPSGPAESSVAGGSADEGGVGGSGAAGVDVLTARAAVVIQDRPVVAAATWLTEVLGAAARAEREVQILTPPGTRLTLAARTLLARLPARWVVRDEECGYYDGLSGTVLSWRDGGEDQGGHFRPATSGPDDRPRIARAFAAPVRAGSAAADASVDEGDGAGLGGGEQQLLLSLRTVHPATGELLLGGALETAWQVLTGAPPAGWSTAEPVNLPWSRRQLTELARGRAREGLPSWITAVGHRDRPALATVRVGHSPLGVEEHITLALGYSAGEAPPVDSLRELAKALATRHHLATMLVQLRAARADLTTPAHFEPAPVPVSFTLGADAVHELGIDRALRAPAPAHPTRLGPSVRPALHYVLGGGGDPAAGGEALQRLYRHLRTG